MITAGSPGSRARMTGTGVLVLHGKVADASTCVDSRRRATSISRSSCQCSRQRSWRGHQQSTRRSPAPTRVRSRRAHSRLPQREPPRKRSQSSAMRHRTARPSTTALRQPPASSAKSVLFLVRCMSRILSKCCHPFEDSYIEDLSCQNFYHDL